MRQTSKRFYIKACNLDIALPQNNETRGTEGVVRGPQYGPCPSIRPDMRSFEGCIEAFGPY